MEESGLVLEATGTVTDTPKKQRAGPAQLLFKGVNDAESVRAIKYPMPLRAARFTLTINGQQCEAAHTTFGEIRYTYFIYNGASFYVPGHHQADMMYEFSHPEGYKFQPLKLDRKAQSDAAAKAKAAKAAATAGAAPAEAAAAAPQESEGGSLPPEPEALHEPPIEVMSGKKSRRAGR